MKIVAKRKIYFSEYLWQSYEELITKEKEYE